MTSAMARSKPFDLRPTTSGALLALSLMSVAACRGGDATAREATVYVSADRPFSEPILQEYQRRSGTRLNIVYDTEETKSTGLANRLLAEKNRPQADVFWSNEPVRTLVLKARGVLAPYESSAASGIGGTFKDRDGYWTGFAARLPGDCHAQMTPASANGRRLIARCRRRGPATAHSIRRPSHGPVRGPLNPTGAWAAANLWGP